MDGLTGFFLSGNILLKVVLFQCVIAAVVVFIMKKALNRELFLAALERLYVAAGENCDDACVIEVVSCASCSAADEARVRALIKERGPSASVIFRVDPSLWGGVIIRMADKVIDCSLSTRIKQFFKVTGV